MMSTDNSHIRRSRSNERKLLTEIFPLANREQQQGLIQSERNHWSAITLRLIVYSSLDG